MDQRDNINLFLKFFLPFRKYILANALRDLDRSPFADNLFHDLPFFFGNDMQEDQLGLQGLGQICRPFEGESGKTGKVRRRQHSIQFHIQSSSQSLITGMAIALIPEPGGAVRGSAGQAAGSAPRSFYDPHIDSNSSF